MLLAARALPGAAAGSKWLLELAPEPQIALMAAEGSKLLLAPGAEPQSARKVLPEFAPEPQNARRMLFELALKPQNVARASRKVPLEPTAVGCVFCLRSKWPLKEFCLLFVYYRHPLLLGSTSLRASYARIHLSIYINMYT